MKFVGVFFRILGFLEGVVFGKLDDVMVVRGGCLKLFRRFFIFYCINWGFWSWIGF